MKSLFSPRYRAWMFAWGLLALMVPWPGPVADAAPPQEVELKLTTEHRTIARKSTLTLTLHIALFRKRFRRLRLPRHRRLRLRKKQRTRRQEAIYTKNLQPRIRYHWVYTLHYKARRSGTFTLSPASIRVGRKTYRTPKLTIEVKDKVTRASAFAFSLPKDLKARADVFLLAVPSHTKAYIGQQIVVSYYLFQRTRCEMSYEQTPRLQGFWSKELFRARALGDWSIHHLQGKRYQYALILRVALFPWRHGTLTLDPLVLRIKRNLADNTDKTRLLSSPPKTIQALPIPTQGRPKGFEDNHVGRFKLTTRLLQSKAETGQPITLSATLEGIGQLKQLSLSPPTPPAGLKLLSTRATQHPKVVQGQLQGKQVTHFSFLAQKPGSYQLPPLTFHYFDPWQKRFVTRKSKAKTLKVTGKTLTQAPAASSNQNPTPAKSKTTTPTAKSKSSSLPKAPIAGGLLLALLLIGFFARRQNKTHQDESITLPQHRFPDYADALARFSSWSSQHPSPNEEAYRQLERNTYELLSALLKTSTRGRSRRSLKHVLQQSSLHQDLLHNIDQLLQLCQDARFAPWPTPPQTPQATHQLLQNLTRLFPPQSP